jgi:photosystem II stability/assembly factor-like uncharacterized protein
MKKLIYILLFVVTQISYSQYWEKVTNIPTPYNNGYYLDFYILPSNTNYIWACGFGGYVIRSTNYGASWQGSTLPQPADHMENIFFVNQSVGYVSGVEGIWKSTDGGASFIDVTPKDSAIYGFWGSYFLNENLGVIVGGGCDNLQRFYKTTNGGASWTLFKSNVIGTGLTDVILYQNGTGIAVSSGYLWITTDYGSTWSLSKSTGTQVWQEEITISGNSILLPFAGSTCFGGGNAGGMRFSTDNGNTWRSFNSGYSMFGAFLTSPTTGWACGYNRSLYYTSDAGATWILRNCGIENVDLDDITFLTSDDGWVVGQGVYHLKPTKFIASKDKIDFGEICYPDSRKDSVIISNHSFYDADMSIILSANIGNAFSIVSPSAISSINQCDSNGIVIKFAPPGNGPYSAKLHIVLSSKDGKTNFTQDVDLIGQGNKSTAAPETNSITLDSVPCGVPTSAFIKWIADDNNSQVKNYSELLDDKGQISFETKTPFYVFKTGTSTEFKFMLADTGWVSQKYRFNLLPCNLDTIINVRAYGVSPIIAVPDSVHFYNFCNQSIIDTIPVKNTGNATLVVSKSIIVSNPSEVQILGWTSKKNEPISIPVGKSDSIIVQFTPKSLTPISYLLRLDNNDKTTIRGNKNPVNVLLVGKKQSEEILLKSPILDFGKVCINTKKDTTLQLENSGNLRGLITQLNPVKSPFALQLPGNTTIDPKQVLDIIFTFSPTKIGDFSDTLFFSTGKCNTLQIIIKGFGVEAKLDISPNIITDVLKSEEPKTKIITLMNSGNEIINIVDYTLTPPTSDFTFDLKPSLNQVIAPNQKIEFNLTINSSKNAFYKGTLCFHTTSLCPADFCIPLDLSSINRFIVWGTNSAFGNIICNGSKSDTIWIKNLGSIQDTITSIDISGNMEFSLLYPNSFPVYIPSKDSLGIVVKFETQNEGNYSADLIVKTIDPDGQTLSFPLNVNYSKSIVQLDSDYIDFGIFERCDNPQIKTTEIRNQGSIYDNISILDKSYPNCFSITPASDFTLNSNSSQTISVEFNPAIASIPGTYSGYVVWINNICGDTNKLTFKAEIQEPHLIYSKKSIDFGSIWVGDVVYDTLIVQNQSNTTRIINNINFPKDFNVITQFPLIVPKKTNANIIFSYLSKQKGDYFDNFIIEESSVCKDTIYISLNAKTPSEDYFATISTQNYSSKAGDTLTISFYLDTKLPKVTADSIEFQLKFDKYLFFPIEFSYISSPNIFKKHTFDYLSGIFNTNFDGKESTSMLTLGDTIMQIKGLVLGSDPNYTPLVIDKFFVFTSKNLSLIKQDGSLTIGPICALEGGNHLIIYPETTFQILAQPLGQKSVDISLQNVKNGDKLEFYNYLGSKVLLIDLTKGSYIKSIDLSNLPQGIYFIKINSLNQKIEKIILQN